MKNLAALLIYIATFFGGVVYSAEEKEPIQSVEIRILGVPEEEKARIDGGYVVSPEKTIRLPGVGDVNIDGLSADEVAKKLRESFLKAEVYTNPTFSVVIHARACILVRNEITVAGFVHKPGPKPFKPGMTIFQAITDAGGVNEFGNMKHVLLMRGKTAKIYDLNKVENQKIELQAGDTIEAAELLFFVK